MCGIFGYLGPELNEKHRVPVPHRGPDGGGQRTFTTPAGPLFFQHWRLSILDLSPAGAQPMSYANERYWIVFNGEIYNYLEIRRELEERGYLFQTRCDTEVLLAAYACWGEECLSHFNGMFAFCIYDMSARRLFVARDRFGIKPLYWINHAQGLALGSEIKQFTQLPFFERRICPQRAFDFLAYGMTDHTADTLFASVKQLRGGECFLLDLNRWRPGQPLPIRRWYTLGHHEAPRERGEAFAEYGELLRDSVRLRLRADVPVGSCLSGGMDSSSIVCLVQRLLSGENSGHPRQKTFSVCSEDPRFDERSYIEHVVKAAGADASYLYLSPGNLFRDLDRLIWHQDEPFLSASIYAQNVLFEEVKKTGVKVMLDGQGGDEQLASYPIFFGAFLLDSLSALRPVCAIRDFRSLRRLNGLKLRSLVQQMAGLYLPASLDRSLRRLMGVPVFPGWLKHAAWDHLGVGILKPWRPAARNPGEDFVRQMSMAQLFQNSLPMLLHWEDRNSMRHGIEARLPFLDYRLVEYAVSLPSEWKFDQGVSKNPLRVAMRGVVPEPVLQRTDKMGFVTPEEVWFRKEATDYFRAAVQETLQRFPEFLDAPAVMKRFEATVDGRMAFSSLFWRILCFGAWARVFRMEM